MYVMPDASPLYSKKISQNNLPSDVEGIKEVKPGATLEVISVTMHNPKASGAQSQRV